MSEVIAIKIRGKFVAFNGDDRFMDNGACVQCLTQGFGYDELSGRKRESVRLTKKAIKEIDAACERVLVPSNYGDSVKIFKLRVKA